MSNNAYTVEGDFQMGRIRQHFAIEVVGSDEDAAREAAYTNMGSRHSVPRRLISIEKVTKLAPDQAGPITRKRL